MKIEKTSASGTVLCSQGGRLLLPPAALLPWSIRRLYTATASFARLFLSLALLVVFFTMPCKAEGMEAGASGMPRVFGATFPSTFSLYVLSPALLAGWNAPLRGYEKPYIPEKYQQLPVLGGWYGQGFFPDREKLLASRIDSVLYITEDREMGVDIEAQLKSIGLPVNTKKIRSLRDTIVIFREMGADYGLPERGNALAGHLQKLLDVGARMTAGLTEDEKIRVYVSQDVDGLGTVCDDGNRSELYALAGAKNVHTCLEGMKESNMKVSFEQIMVYDPDVILILHPVFMQRFPSDARWQNLRAVREGRVFFVPHEPFNWTDKPATFMRFIALPWLICKFHPDRCDVDIARETAEFMQLFFDLDLNDAAIDKILLR